MDRRLVLLLMSFVAVASHGRREYSAVGILGARRVVSGDNGLWNWHHGKTRGSDTTLSALATFLLTRVPPPFRLGARGSFVRVPDAPQSLTMQKTREASEEFTQGALARSSTSIGSSSNSAAYDRIMSSSSSSISSSPVNVEDTRHGRLLPKRYTDKIPLEHQQVLTFMLRFLEEEGHCKISIFINGGYVRDLLMNQEPDDLDISLDLRHCGDDILVTSLLDKASTYAEKRPELGIREISVFSILGNDAKNKLLDTCKCKFLIDKGNKIEVDFMPTSGEEKYENGSRTPHRNQRGSPKEDALRRDLTVGALLLRVKPEAVDGSLSYILYDYYGGIQDFNEGVLRAPVPPIKQYSELAPDILQTHVQRTLAKSLGLDRKPESERLQILWWAKILSDDPVRACRALRFSFTLPGFKLHDSFWEAFMFAIPALQSVVAGSRKAKEFLKILGVSNKAAIDFIELAFTKEVGPNESLAIPDAGLHGKMRIASCLFSGVPQEGEARGLSLVTAFDNRSFHTMAGAVEKDDDIPRDALFSGLLVAAIASTDTDAIEDEFEKVCDGLSTSRDFRRSGRAVLRIAMKWANESVTPDSLDEAMANICNVSAEDMRFYVMAWQDFGCPSSAPKMRASQQELILRLSRHLASRRYASAGSRSPSSDDERRWKEALRLVSIDRPALSGRLAKIMDLPPRHIGHFLAALEVSLRLLNIEEAIETVEDIQALFIKVPQFREALAPEIFKACDDF